MALMQSKNSGLRPDAWLTASTRSITNRQSRPSAMPARTLTGDAGNPRVLPNSEGVGDGSRRSTLKASMGQFLTCTLCKVWEMTSVFPTPALPDTNTVLADGSSKESSINSTSAEAWTEHPGTLISPEAVLTGPASGLPAASAGLRSGSVYQGVSAGQLDRKDVQLLRNRGTGRKRGPYFKSRRKSI